MGSSHSTLHKNPFSQVQHSLHHSMLAIKRTRYYHLLSSPPQDGDRTSLERATVYARSVDDTPLDEIKRTLRESPMIDAYQYYKTLCLRLQHQLTNLAASSSE